MVKKDNARKATGTNEDIEFITTFNGKIAEVKCILPPGNSQYLIIIHISDGTQSVLYEYDMFIECLIASRISKFTAKDKNINQFRVLNQLNFDLLRIIGQVKIDTNGYKPIRNYHTEEHLRLLETSINNLKLELEIEKLDKENRLFTLPIKVSIAAVVIAAIMPLVTLLLQDKPEPKRILMIQEAQMPKPTSGGGAASNALDSPLNKAGEGHDTTVTSH